MGMMLRRYHQNKEQKVEEVINYGDFTAKELKDIAKKRSIDGYSTLNKEELVSVLEG